MVQLRRILNLRMLAHKMTRRVFHVDFGKSFHGYIERLAPKRAIWTFESPASLCYDRMLDIHANVISSHPIAKILDLSISTSVAA